MLFRTSLLKLGNIFADFAIFLKKKFIKELERFKSEADANLGLQGSLNVR